MRKTIIITLISGYMAISAVNAQSIQEGVNHLYADRFQSASATFKKLLALNPNNIEATYWLGQTYLDMDDNELARQLYENALLTSANAPLLLVGKGHVLLLENKLTEARQNFETAIAASKGKKGDDPVILNAIGRANIDAKNGDHKYAIEKLEIAAQRDPKNADIFLNLGNAYRKEGKGDGGGLAYSNYNKALAINPNFAYAYLRLAKLFETQQNWDLVLQNLMDAIAKDPGFSLAYYELFYYYWWFKQDFTQAEAMLKKYTDNRPNEDHIEDNYLYSQLCWARKDFDCAIEKAESVARSMGSKIKPRVYRQLAYSYFGKGSSAIAKGDSAKAKGDYEKAKNNIDVFFLKSKDGPIPEDFKLKAEILSGLGAADDEIYKVFIDGAALDTILQSKIDFLNKGVDFFKAKGNKCLEANLRLVVYNTRKNPKPGELFFIGLPMYQCGQLNRADSIFKAYSAALPDSIFGHFWGARVNSAIDTTMQAGLAVPQYEKTLALASKDMSRLSSFGIEAAGYLAGYYNNIKSDVTTAISYINKGLEFDSTNVNLKRTKELLDRIQQQNQSPKKTNGSSPKPTGKLKAKKKAIAVKP